jgi:hypothetical protein
MLSRVLLATDLPDAFINVTLDKSHDQISLESLFSNQHSTKITSKAMDFPFHRFVGIQYCT